MASRIAVVGAGPSGLAQLHAFEQARAHGGDVPEIVCFEKQSDWGGLWNYNWRTGLDEHGEPVHGSMYRYLWSNGPKECLEFADYTFDEHFGKPIPSFPPREVLYDYITGRAKKSDVRRFIEFNTAVRWIAYDEGMKRFTVTVEDLEGLKTRSEQFDYVIVATGHFSTPSMPAYEGFEQFPGRIMHSHDFRDAREFVGKNLLVIGSQGPGVLEICPALSDHRACGTWVTALDQARPSCIWLVSSQTFRTYRENAGAPGLRQGVVMSGLMV